MRIGAVVAAIALLAACSSSTRHHAPGNATAPPPTTRADIVPGPGQTIVDGDVTTLHAGGAVGPPIAVPFTISAVERGRGGATIDNALQGTARVSIVWSTGTPLPVSGAGSLAVAPGDADIDSHGITWTLDGRVRAFGPGRYHLSAPVAVGQGGLAEPKDSADFVADAQTGLTARGGVVVHLDPRPVDLSGPGALRAMGRFTARTTSGTSTPSTVTFGPGPFTLSVRFEGAAVRITATLQGPAVLR